MWKRLRNVFSGKSQTDNLQTDNSQNTSVTLPTFDDLKAQVQKVLKLDLSTDSSREEHNEQVFDTLQKLNTEIEKIRQLANDYPTNPIKGDVWFSGAGYSNLAHALTEHFKAAGWLKHEDNASMLWAKATLAVMSHYHHAVGPAMLANADCQERLGNTERAALMYTGVVKDFVFLLEDYADTTDAPSDEDRISLECLERASERLLTLDTKTVEAIDLRDVRSQLTTVLSRSITS